MLFIPHADTESSDQGGNVVNRIYPQIVKMNERAAVPELKIKEITEKNATVEENLYKLQKDVSENNPKCMSGIGKLNAWFDGLNHGSLNTLKEVVNTTSNGLEDLRNRINKPSPDAGARQAQSRLCA